MKMKKLYLISSGIIAVITFIVFAVMIQNEDRSWWIVPPLFAAIAFGLSFLSSLISKRIIFLGDKIRFILIRILYYICIPIAIFALFVVIYSVGTDIYDTYPVPHEMGAALGHALVFLFIMAVVFVAMILPYVQSLVVLILRKIFSKHDDNIDTPTEGSEP